MKITRIFRKYSRVLLLVFMSLLLVVFLLGDVISRAGRNRAMRDVEIGQAFGEPVYLSQTRAAEADFQLAARLRVATPATWIDSSDPREQNLAMYLLLEEARRAGIRVGRDQVVEALQRNPQAPYLLSAIRKSSGRSLNSIYDSVARVSATMVLVSYQLDAAMSVSLPQLEQTYRDRTQEARVLISVIDCNALLWQIPTPSTEELRAHFEQAKDRNAAHTEQELVYGYRIPNRVQVEYLTVDPAAIQDLVSVRAREVVRYYEDNKHKYVKTVEDAPQFTLDDGPPQKIQMTYEEVKGRVREDYRAAKAIKDAQRLVNDIHHKARLPWDTAPLDQNNVPQTPSDEELVSFTELQKELSDRYPVIYKKTELVTEGELRREPGFGRAAATVEQQPVFAPTLAFRVEGLTTAESGDPSPILRINEPGPVVLQTRGTDATAGPAPYQAYVFRVVRVEPSGPPESLDDVRAQAIEDLRRSKAFELAGEKARTLAEHARQVGLKQAVAEAKDLRALLGETEESPTTQPTTEPATRPSDSNRYLGMLEPFEPEQFFRRPRFPLENVGYSPNLHEEVFALADNSGPDPSEEHRTVAVPLAISSQWAVVELLEVKPIYRGDFAMSRERLEQEIAWTQQRAYISAWFSPENVLRRAGFVPATQIEP